MGAQRQRIVLEVITGIIDDVRGRRLRLILRLDNDLLLQARRLVALHLIRRVFHEALELDLTGDLGNDHGVERVPFDDHVALLHGIAIIEEQLGSIRDIVCHEDNLRVRVYQTHLGQTADDNLEFLAVLLGIDRTQLLNLKDHVVIFTRQAVLRSDVGRDTTDVERTQRQLRTRLTDRLRGDDTDHLTFLYHPVGSQVTAITFRANTLLRLASKYGTDLDTLDRRILDLLRRLLADLLARLDENLAGDRVDNVVNRDTTQDTLVEGSDHLLVVLQLRTYQTTQRTAILLVDDHVVRNVDKTTGQISRVGSLQRRIGQTLTGTVRRDEVLQH